MWGMASSILIPLIPSAVRSTVGRDGSSAELLGQRDDDALGAADVAEPIDVLVLRQLADEFGAVGAQAGNDVLDVAGLRGPRVAALSGTAPGVAGPARAS